MISWPSRAPYVSFIAVLTPPSSRAEVPIYVERETAGGASASMTRAQRALAAQFQRNARLAAERIEHSPWTFGIRAARAEAELTGNHEAFDDLVRRYKKYEAERWPR
jgi:hypothetical protein